MSDILPPLASRRVQKELERFNEEGGVLHVEAVSATQWRVRMPGVPGTLYEGEIFTLQITFDKGYPMECAEVSSLSLSLSSFCTHYLFTFPCPHIRLSFWEHHRSIHMYIQMGIYA